MKKTTTELFVSYLHGVTTDFYEVYTTRKEAEKVNNENNDSYERITNSSIGTGNHPKRPYTVITLSEAMDKLREYWEEYGEESMRCQMTGDETINY